MCSTPSAFVEFVVSLFFLKKYVIIKFFLSIFILYYKIVFKFPWFCYSRRTFFLSPFGNILRSKSRALFENSSPSLFAVFATKLSRFCCVPILGAGIFVLLLLLFVLVVFHFLVLLPIGMPNNSSLIVSL